MCGFLCLTNMLFFYTVRKNLLFMESKKQSFRTTTIELIGFKEHERSVLTRAIIEKIKAKHRAEKDVHENDFELSWGSNTLQTITRRHTKKVRVFAPSRNEYEVVLSILRSVHCNTRTEYIAVGQYVDLRAK